MEKYPRKCSVTKEGMDKGWCWCDGAPYTKYLKDTFKCIENKEAILADLDEIDYTFENDIPKEQEKYLCEKAKNTPEELTPGELMQIAYGVSWVYYTEWEELEEIRYDLQGNGYVDCCNCRKETILIEQSCFCQHCLAHL